MCSIASEVLSCLLDLWYQRHSCQTSFLGSPFPRLRLPLYVSQSPLASARPIHQHKHMTQSREVAYIFVFVILARSPHFRPVFVGRLRELLLLRMPRRYMLHLLLGLRSISVPTDQRDSIPRRAHTYSLVGLSPHPRFGGAAPKLPF